ncbi:MULTISPECIES: hypothetical protein [Microcystis]|uniref:hypothetical protein n=1 Tax=Microcystis TaxID=1125 RepID=UPI0007767A84|nr:MULTISPECIES: hypothetical protein [Microcystis]MCA2903398.1 hypothetical protein [Microcystis sp. M035S1]KXS89843.1 hypothetical protein OA58_19025 [Microcystis aeruginosa NIES-88]MCA2721343.1 hypothetical protein [Microcystis sp. M176S2]MCA2724798.1 hypothetical protein [Microcystis sp. M166S2]MCA2728489.1 hypothetical protein [Microcystis sp. M162S2]
MMALSPFDESNKINIEAYFHWLVTRINHLPDSDINSLLQTYIAIVICHDIEPKILNESIKIVKNLTAKLILLSEHQFRSSNLILLSLAAISTYRLLGTQLPNIVDHVKKVIDKLPEKSSDNSLNERPILFLAGTLNLIPKPSFKVMNYKPDLLALLNADDLAIQKSITELENLTVYGIVRTPIYHGLIDVLEVILFEYLQNYNLKIALRLFRMLNYLNVSTKYGIQKSFAFINNQQCPDGSFGFSELEIAKMDIEFQFNDLKNWFKLQNTFSYLWLTAEQMNSDYRLLRDIGRGPIQGSSLYQFSRV